MDVTVTGTTAPPIPADVTVGTPDPATGVVRGTLPATDASGAPLTYTVTTPPAYGRVTIRPDGSYVYVPSAAGQALRAHAPGRRRHLHGAGVLGGPVELHGPRRPR